MERQVGAALAACVVRGEGDDAGVRVGCGYYVRACVRAEGKAGMGRSE